MIKVDFEAYIVQNELWKLQSIFHAKIPWNLFFNDIIMNSHWKSIQRFFVWDTASKCVENLNTVEKWEVYSPKKN